MTGNHVFQLSLDPTRPRNGPAKTWSPLSTREKKKKVQAGLRIQKHRTESFNHDDIWTLLKKHDAQNAFVSASIGKRADREIDGPVGEQMLEKIRRRAYAYSISAAVEFAESFGAMLGGRCNQIKVLWS
jgi:hypothetical protein